MRATFLLLLLANLLFLAWWQGYLGPRGTEGREPQRLDAQVAADKIRLLKAKGERPGGAAGAAPAVAANLAGPAGSAAPSAMVCREIGAQSLDDAEHLKAAFGKIAPEISVTQKAIQEPSYWVNIPPLPTRLAADKKSAELKRLGLAEYYVVQEEGPNRNAISLGLFRTEQAANDFIASLAKKRVRGARIQTRDNEATQAKLELRAPAERLNAAVVGELVKKAGVSLGDCPAP